MSLARVVLVLIQAAFNELACTPPNPTPDKGRYDIDQPWIFRIAPVILRIHQLLLRLFTVFEVLTYLASIPPLAEYSSLFSSAPKPAQSLHPTPLFLLGVLFVLFGASLRLICFRALGPLFTFHLTVHPAHTLVTTGPYSHVRHPAYTGSLLIIAGLAFSHLSPGSWVWVYLLHGDGAQWWSPLSGPVIAAVWWLWTLAIGLDRVEAEDKQMHLLFPGSGRRMRRGFRGALFQGLFDSSSLLARPSRPLPGPPPC
ncbi:hypothetical protein B0H11DRAFT_2282508 [Mycena galericulata]|nr:hypothetical protein B0H11DRAFT_2282508 [Mycena galericulata]